MLLCHNQTIVRGKISCNNTNYYITAFYQDINLLLIEVTATVVVLKTLYDRYSRPLQLLVILELCNLA